MKFKNIISQSSQASSNTVTFYRKIQICVNVHIYKDTNVTILICVNVHIYKDNKCININLLMFILIKTINATILICVNAHIYKDTKCNNTFS